MPPKRKQSKKTWRKRGEVFEEAVQTARQQRDQDVRTGGSFSGLADADLFSITGAKESATAKREKRRRPLHTEKKLGANRNVPIVSKEPTKGAKPTKAQNGGFDGKIAKLRTSAARRAQQRPARKSDAAPAVFDLWGDVGSTASALKVRQQRGKAAVPELAGAETRAVVVAAAGASYNPTREAHQALLGQAVDHELERLRRIESHRSAALDGNVPTGRAAQDDTEKADEGEGEGEDGDDPASAEWHRTREKLTLQKRKGLKRARDLEQQQREAAAERKREKQFGRVGQLVSEIKKEAKGLRARQETEREKEEIRPRKLGKLKYEAHRPEVLLTEELPANLRSLPAVPAREGLMNDRFMSMQARNLIEPRKQAPKSRTRKHKAVTKNSAKDIQYTSPFELKGGGRKLPAWL